MPDFNIRPTHKPIKEYYAELERYAQLSEQNEGTVRIAFQNLLQHYCHQANLTLLCEKSLYTQEKRRITPDGEIVDAFGTEKPRSRSSDLLRLFRISPPFRAVLHCD